MNGSIRLCILILLSVLFLASACAPVPSPTASPVPSASPTSIPTATKPAPTATSIPTATATAIPIFWDDFSKELLPGWTWIRENDALWSLDSEPGFLRLVLQGDPLPRNLLVRDVTHENFQIETHLRFEPTSNFQFAGLLVYQDDDNRAALGRAYCNVQNQCVGNGIYFDGLQNGQLMGANFATDTQVKDEVYLRIDKNRSTLTGYYSEDGTEWFVIGKHELALLNPKVGILTGNSHIVGMTAYFDYFTVMEMP